MSKKTNSESSTKPKSRRAKGTGSIVKIARGKYCIRWRSHTGRPKKEVVFGEYATAEQVLASKIRKEQEYKSGLADPEKEKIIQATRAAIDEHLNAYLQFCKNRYLNKTHYSAKVRHIKRYITCRKITRLEDITAENFQAHMFEMATGKTNHSARTCNYALESMNAFCNWCVKTLRLTKNPLGPVERMNQDADRRRIRRALTDDELKALLETTDERGRKLWYMLAAYAGLRRGDLIRLTWGQVDFENNVITIRMGKAKRTDHIPMCDELREALQAERGGVVFRHDTKVFEHPVSHKTRMKDFWRAGLATRTPILDAEGEHKKSKWNELLYEYSTKDENNCEIDLHACRSWLATRLARAGVPVQVAQKFLRHAKPETTQKYYTKLGGDDLHAAAGVVQGTIGHYDPESRALSGTLSEEKSGKNGENGGKNASA